MTQQNIDRERARKRADASFRAQVREVEGRKASKEYWAAQQEALDRIPRLRAARLEREAQEALDRIPRLRAARLAREAQVKAAKPTGATVSRRAKG